MISCHHDTMILYKIPLKNYGIGATSSVPEAVSGVPEAISGVVEAISGVDVVIVIFSTRTATFAVLVAPVLSVIIAPTVWAPFGTAFAPVVSQLNEYVGLLVQSPFPIFTPSTS